MDIDIFLIQIIFYLVIQITYLVKRQRLTDQ